jgi:hypothetical protein
LSSLFLRIWHRQPVSHVQIQQIDTLIRKLGKVLDSKEECWLLISDNPRLHPPLPIDILIEKASGSLLEQLISLRDDLQQNAVDRVDRHWGFWLQDSTALPGAPPVEPHRRAGLWGHTVNVSLSYDLEHLFTGIGEDFRGISWVSGKLGILSKMLDWWGVVPRASTWIIHNPSGLDLRIIGYLALSIMEQTDGILQLIPQTLSLPETLNKLRVLTEEGDIPGTISPDFYMDAEFLRMWLQHPDFSLW